MLKPLLIVSTLALLTFAALPAAGPTAQEPSPTAQKGAKISDKSAPDSQARAKELYERDCALCHGSSGDGKTDVAKGMGITPGDFTDPKTLAGKRDDELFKSIRNGKGKMFPEDPGRAKDAEVRSLILYIRTLAKGAPAAEPAAPTAPATPAPAAPDTPAPAAPATPAPDAPATPAPAAPPASS